MTGLLACGPLPQHSNVAYAQTLLGTLDLMLEYRSAPGREVQETPSLRPADEELRSVGHFRQPRWGTCPLTPRASADGEFLIAA